MKRFNLYAIEEKSKSGNVSTILKFCGEEKLYRDKEKAKAMLNVVDSARGCHCQKGKCEELIHSKFRLVTIHCEPVGGFR